MQLTKTQAEEIVMRSAQWLVDLKSNLPGAGDHIDDVYRDFSMLGMAIKFQLEQDTRYQEGIKMLAAENARLHATVSTLVLDLGEVTAVMENLSKELQQHEEAWAMLDEAGEKKEDDVDEYVAAIVRQATST